MKFSELHFRSEPGDEPESGLFKSSISRPCACCGSPSEFLEANLGLCVCSEECLEKAIRDFIVKHMPRRQQCDKN